MAKCWTVFYGFAHNFLVSRPFLTRKVLNWSSQDALHIGQGAVSLIQFSVWSTVQSNLGQTWLNLSKFREMYPGPRFEGFWVYWTPVRSERLGQTPVKLGQLWSNLVKLREMRPRPHLEVILMWWAFVRSSRLGSDYLVLHANVRENPGGKNRVMTTCLKCAKLIFFQNYLIVFNNFYYSWYKIKNCWKLKKMWEKYWLMNWYVNIYTKNKTTNFHDFLWDT